jgi:hypothetical protein
MVNVNACTTEGLMNRNAWLPKLGRFLRSSEGKADSKVPTMLLFLALGLGGYVGWQYFVPYWNNRTLSDLVKDAAVFDPFEKKKPTEDSIREVILRQMREAGIRFDPTDPQGQKLEIIQKTELAYEVHLRYKEIIRVYGLRPVTRYYNIDFDGTEMSKAMIKDKPIR